jgi:hypothetical protein
LHSSDETGDERKGLATTGGAAHAATESDPASLPAKLPSHAFRERIRRASVAAAHSSAAHSSVAPNATDSVDASGSPSSLVPPEQSGVHDRKSDEPGSSDARPAGRGCAESGEPDASALQAAQAEQSEADDPTLAPTSKLPGAAALGGPGNPNSSGVPSGLRRPTPPAWPFAGSSRDDRRPQYHTQLGLGLPQRTAIPTAKREAPEMSDASEMSDARRRMDTRDTKRSGAAHPNAVSKPASAPSAHKVTPARPFRAHDSSKWSPTSTKPQRASLLRSDTPKSGAAAATSAAEERDTAPIPKALQPSGQAAPSIQVNIASSLDTGQSEVSRLAAAPLDPVKYSRRLGATALDGSGRSQAKAADGGENDAARARRYTPKQRPTQRRGRKGAELSDQNHAEQAQDHGDHADKDPRELAVTVPDLRIPSSARPPALPFLNVTKPGASQIVTPDTPTQPRGRPVPRLPFAAPPASAFSPPAAFSHSPAFSPPPAFQPAGPRSPFSPAVTRRDASHSQHEASIVVDPTLNGTFTEVRPSQVQVSEAPSGYQPLPSDPAAFEQLMREQAAARGSRLNWKQQATLVIPRESLELPEERRFINPKVVFGFLAASAAGALLMLGISQFSGPDAGVRVATDTSTSAASASGTATVIATEPSGAELLLDGAVVGNTPLEVVRPPRGQGEHTYVVRLRGFTQELVRLNSESQPAIRVTLSPESGVP